MSIMPKLKGIRSQDLKGKRWSRSKDTRKELKEGNGTEEAAEPKDSKLQEFIEVSMFSSQRPKEPSLSKLGLLLAVKYIWGYRGT